MESREIDLLKALSRQDDPSQRELASMTDMSLGTINSLIKKCARKGLVKIDRADSQSMRYMLTPAGIKKLTSRTLEYIQRSYQAIKKLRLTLKQKASADREQGRRIYLYGARDEVFELVVSTLDEIDVSYTLLTGLDDLHHGDNDVIVYYWNPEHRDELAGNSVEHCNILQLEPEE